MNMQMTLSRPMKVFAALGACAIVALVGNVVPAEPGDQDMNQGMNQNTMEQPSMAETAPNQADMDQQALSGDTPVDGSSLENGSEQAQEQIQEQAQVDQPVQEQDAPQQLAAVAVDTSAAPESGELPDAGALPVRSPHAGVSADLFGRTTWYTPPPPPPQVRQARQYQPAAPTAPPLPFSVMGSYEEEGEPTLYFLVKGDRVFDARVGDVLEGTYRVDGPSNGQLKFTYLPLNISQGIQLGESQ
jgi:hypothetical protein